MFDGLSEINWESFGKHIAIMKESGDIPKWIHQLLSEDHELRLYAIDSLFGSEQHTGMIAAATPHMIPFVIEVLTQSDYPDSAYLLHKFSFVADYILNPGKRVSDIRRAVATYDALVTGLTTYLNLLNNDDPETRFYDAKLLRYFQEQSFTVLDALMHRLNNEFHSRVRIVMLRSMAGLIIDAYLMYADEYDRYREFIMSRMTDGTDIAERFAAADITRKMGRKVDKEMMKAMEMATAAYYLEHSDQEDAADPFYFEIWQ